jgi:serine/threonine-protein kinase
MEQVVSHYRIIRKIGAGGMGEVYLAEDTKLHRKVALKMLPFEQGGDPERLLRFLQEAHAASALNHPNIAVIYEVGETNGKAPFIAMEYVAGAGLDDEVSKGPLPVDEIVDLGMEIADALDEAHAKGIVHRDLKPSNVMVTARRHAKVLDFGLAKVTLLTGDQDVESSTRVKSAPGLVVGTVPYMSPEQALGRHVDHRSDIFSFGALLYEMATGQRAFHGNSSTEIIEAIVHSQPRAIAQLNYDVPPELDRVIRKCLEKNPESRYQWAREIVVDLKNLKRDSSAEHPPGSATPKWRLGTIAGAATGLLALFVIAWYVVHHRASSSTVLPVDSLAVLPFVNTSNDPKNEYLSDGITESIINSISQLPQLKVLSRNSVFRFKGRNVDAQDVGRQLKVRAVVSGRVLQLGDRLTVGAELLDVGDGRQLWGEQYNRKIADIFGIQEEISRDISEKLRIKLSGDQQQRLTKRYTNDPEAYALYLKGRYYWNKRTASGLQRAIEFFQQAIDRDPNYALAYVGLADAYAILPEYSDAPPPDANTRARAAAQKALQIDDSLAEAHASLGAVEQNDWNLSAAGRQFQRAIDLKPNYATARHWSSLNHRRLKELDAALEEIRKAQQLDPLSPIINLNVGLEHWTRGEDEQAIRAYKATLELDPHFGYCYSYLGRVYTLRGQCNEALQLLRKGDDLTEHGSEPVAFLGYGLARCGDRNGALKLAAELERRKASGVYRAILYVGLGDFEKTFEQLEAAYKQRDGSLMDLSCEPEFKPIRADPRYLDLTRRLRLPL